MKILTTGDTAWLDLPAWLQTNGYGGGAQAAQPAVTSVAGRTGAVVVTKADVGLSSVDNTSDANKPVSAATQTALDAKQAALGFTAVPTTRTVAGKALSADVSIAKADVGLGNVDNTSDASKPVSTATQTALNGKQASLGFTPVANSRTVAGKALTADVVLVKADVGLGNVDNTADANKPVSTATQSALNAKADSAAVPNASYRTILDCSGSHTAARVAGTYFMPQSQALGISGTGTLYPPNTVFIAAADYPTLNGVAPKLRIRAQLYTNDVAPTGNFTLGLYPVTRPATSGGAGLCIFTLGTVVSGSNGATFTTPAADGLLQSVGADFALPADGHYVIGVVTTGTVATNAHVQITASLQMRNA